MTIKKQTVQEDCNDVLLRYKQELRDCKKAIKYLLDRWVDENEYENPNDYITLAKKEVFANTKGILDVKSFNKDSFYFVLCPSECQSCEIAMGYNNKEEFTSWVVQTKKQAKKEEMIMKKEKQVKEKQAKKANKFTVKQVVLTMIDKKGLLTKGSEIKKAFPEVLKEVEKYFPDTKFSYNCLAWYVAKARKGLIGTAKPVTKKPEVKKMKFKKAK